MIKHNKIILLFTTVLLVLLLGLTMTTAADTNTTTSQTPSHIEHTTPQTTQKIQTTDNNKINKEVQSNTTSKKVVKKEKKTKQDKNIKQATINKEVNNYQELQQAVTDADNDNTNEYNIKLNQGNYTYNTTLTWGTGSTKQITIDMNNQETKRQTGLISYVAFFEVKNGYSLILKNPNNYYFPGINNYGTVTLGTSTISSSINNYGNIVLENITPSRIDETSNIGNITFKNCNITNQMRTQRANITLINSTINNSVTCNAGNIYLLNCTVNASVTASQNLTISDDTILGNNTKLSGKLITNKTDAETFGYLSSYNGNYTIENMTITGSSNMGNLTLINSVISSPSTFINYGNMVLINSTSVKTLTNRGGNITISNSVINGQLNNYDSKGNIYITNNTIINNTISNSAGNLTIDDTVIINGKITGNGKLITNNTQAILSLETLNGNYTLTNATITGQKTNRGNLTLKNSTINGTIINNGNLTISDDTVFGSNAIINNQGTLNTNRTDIYYYFNNYAGNYTINNFTITTIRINTGNLTLNNCTINNSISNIRGNLTLNNCTINNIINILGNLTLKNCIINGTITNNGNLTISDDTVFGSNAQISNTGKIISNKTDYISYLTSYNGNYTLTNTVFTHGFSNSGNLTLINCTIKDIYNGNNYGTTTNTYGLLTNRGNLTLINCNITNNTAKMNNNFFIFKINSRGNLTLINTTIYNNNISGIVDGDFSTQTGSNYGVINIINSTFRNNYKNNVVSGGINDNVKDIKYDIYVKDNNANVTLINSTFINGDRGVIIERGNNTIVDNCTFRNKSINISGSGGAGYYYGAGLLLNTRNVLVNNSLFEDNSLDVNNVWLYNGGAAIAIVPNYNDNNVTIVNSIFKNNKMNGTSTAGASRSDSHSATGTDIYILNSAYYDTVNILIENNTFNSSYSSVGSVIYIANNMGYRAKEMNSIIVNNSFNNTHAKDTLSINSTNSTIENNNYTNCSIAFSNFTLNNPGKVFVNDTVNITGNIVLSNPASYDQDILNKTQYEFYIGRNLYKVENTFSTTLTRNNDEQIIITAKPTISSNITNPVVLKLSTRTQIIITPENIDGYLFNNELIGIDEGSIIYFKGNFTNLKTINIITAGTRINGSNATFINTSFQLEEDNITITDMKINNTQTSEYAISTSGNNNIIANNTITVNNTQGKTAAIANQNGENNTITQNNITVYGPTESITFTNGANAANTQGILSAGGENNQITYNNIHVYNSTNPDDSIYSTVEGITAPGRSNNVLIAYNNVTVTGGRFNYGIDALGGVNNTQIKENNIHVTGHRYIDGIQIGNMATNSLVTANNITGTCYNTTVYTEDNEPMAFGIITSNMGTTTKTDNITITDNNINLNSSIVYGMEIYQTANSTINNNTINANGNYTMGLSLAHSPNNTVENNTMNLQGNSNTTINYIVEEIRPANTGVQVQQDSDNSTVKGNNIKVNDVAGNDIAVNVENRNITVADNQLRTSKNTGNNAVTGNGENITITNNTIAKLDTNININPVNTTLYEYTNITAAITDEYGNNVNGGQVFFKINGKTLTDNYGNNIYVDVVNGTAALNYYADSIKANTTTIVYTGNEYYNTARSNTTVNIAKTNATMKLEILNDNIKPGETAIIMVTVTDKYDNMIKSGKVIFKLNGKTIKDSNGSTITVRIHNGVAIFKYVVPANYSAKNYTLTAVSVGNTYNRVEAVTNLTLTKINTYIQPVNIQFTNNTLHVQANIISTSTQTNTAYRETKVTVKINNKTFAKEVRITNGTIDLNIDTSSIGRGNYKITIKAGENGIYTGTQLDNYAYKAPVKQALNQTSNNGTLVKA